MLEPFNTLIRYQKLMHCYSQSHIANLKNWIELVKGRSMHACYTYANLFFKENSMMATLLLFYIIHQDSPETQLNWFIDPKYIIKLYFASNNKMFQKRGLRIWHCCDTKIFLQLPILNRHFLTCHPFIRYVNSLLT